MFIHLSHKCILEGQTCHPQCEHFFTVSEEATCNFQYMFPKGEEEGKQILSQIFAHYVLSFPFLRFA